MNSFRLKPMLKSLGILALVMLFSACLFEERGEDKRVLTDGDYTPVKPKDSPGWPAIQWPQSNPYSAEKAILGRRLFFDPILSRTKDRACAWCHAPAAAFADPRRGEFSVGVEQGVTTRNSPAVINMAFNQFFFLDGRASSLEEQALGPLSAPNEMDMTTEEIVARLSSDSAYVRLFGKAFGTGSVTLERVAKALATYQRTLVSQHSKYDRWRAGDSLALTPSAKRGFELFMSTRTSCSSCHVPPLFTDGNFHNIGLETVTVDSGRGSLTGVVGDVGKFKTPTLRNIEESNPYMHDGRFRTLEHVVAHYNRGGEFHPNKDSRIRPLGLTAGEANDLVEFLRALTDSVFLESPVYVP